MKRGGVLRIADRNVSTLSERFGLVLGLCARLRIDTLLLQETCLSTDSVASLTACARNNGYELITHEFGVDVDGKLVRTCAAVSKWPITLSPTRHTITESTGVMWLNVHWPSMRHLKLVGMHAPASDAGYRRQFIRQVLEMAAAIGWDVIAVGGFNVIS